MLDLIKDSDMELHMNPNTYGGVDRIISQVYLATIPVVFTSPEPFATSEPTKIAAATNTIQPDCAMSNWYEMKMPETVADTAKHIESIIVFLKERA